MFKACAEAAITFAQALLFLMPSVNNYERSVARQFAQEMVDKYRCLLRKAAGLQSISVDGQTVSLKDLESQLEHWERKFAMLDCRRPRISQITMGGV